jgi:hypothetical protein
MWLDRLLTEEDERHIGSGNVEHSFVTKDTSSPAVALMASQLSKRKEVRIRWKKDAKDLLVAHEFALSAIYRAIDRFSGRKFDPRGPSVEGRMSLTAQFLQGVEPCESAISEGLYAQAAALLKQEMETIEAMHEFVQGTRREGRTPRIGGRLVGWGPIYGDMNSIAHVSRRDIALELVRVELGDLAAPSLIPVYNHELAKLMYGLHVFMIFDIARLNHDLFQELYGEGLDEEEFRWLFAATRILSEAGAVIPVETPT